MPKPIGPHSAPETAGTAYRQAKERLEELAIAIRATGPGPAQRELARFMRAVEERGADLTHDELARIERDLEACLRGHELLDAARNGDEVSVRYLIGEGGAAVNFQDPRTGATALHYAAAFRARPVVRTLLKSGKCDFLIRDNKGRLAWELASNADDPALARLLISKTVKQASEQGVPFRRRERAQR